MLSSTSGSPSSRSARIQKPQIRIIKSLILCPISAMSYIQMTVRFINAQYHTVSEFIRAISTFWISMMGMPSPHLTLLPVSSGQAFPTIRTLTALPVPSFSNCLFVKRHGYHLPKVIDGWLEVEIETFWVFNKADTWTGLTIAKDPPWVTSAKDDVCYIIRFYPQNSPDPDYIVCMKPTIEEAMSFAEEYYTKLGLSTTIEENQKGR